MFDSACRLDIHSKAFLNRLIPKARRVRYFRDRVPGSEHAAQVSQLSVSSETDVVSDHSRLKRNIIIIYLSQGEIFEEESRRYYVSENGSMATRWPSA